MRETGYQRYGSFAAEVFIMAHQQCLETFLPTRDRQGLARQGAAGKLGVHHASRMLSYAWRRRLWLRN